jgi:hypothetical protein
VKAGVLPFAILLFIAANVRVARAESKPPMPQRVGVWLHPCEREPLAFNELLAPLTDERSEDGVDEVVELDRPAATTDSWLELVADCGQYAMGITVTAHGPRAEDASRRVQFGDMPRAARPHRVAVAAADLAHETWTPPVNTAQRQHLAPIASAPSQPAPRPVRTVPRVDLSLTAHLAALELGGQALGRYGYLAAGGFVHAFVYRPGPGKVSESVWGGLGGLALRAPSGFRFDLLALLGAFLRHTRGYDPESASQNSYRGDPGVGATIPCAGVRARVSDVRNRGRVHFEWGAQLSYYRDLIERRVTYQFEASDGQGRPLGTVERTVRTGGRDTFQFAVTLGITADLL